MSRFRNFFCAQRRLAQMERHADALSRKLKRATYQLDLCHRIEAEQGRTITNGQKAIDLLTGQRDALGDQVADLRAENARLRDEPDNKKETTE